MVSYFANSDKSKIELSESFECDLVEYNDVVYYEPINLYDIKSGWKLTFKTRENHGFIDIYQISVIKSEPVYKPGDDRDKITSLYNNVKKLDEILEDYKKETINWGVENNIEYLFGDSAKRYYWNKLNEK